MIVKFLNMHCLRPAQHRPIHMHEVLNLVQFYQLFHRANLATCKVTRSILGVLRGKCSEGTFHEPTVGMFLIQWMSPI